jgi:two-component system chemotaxis sensor kinase CheA
MFNVADEKLLQEFLVEAGEIAEGLATQLVALEQRPQDQELLNSVFRGFHTIKGGASFLSLDSLVELCHRAEDVFNVLRRGERALEAGLMDAVLQALDGVNAVFQCLRESRDLPAPQPELLAALAAFAAPAQAAPVATPAPPATTPSKPVAASDAVDDEFERMLTRLAPAPAANAAGDEISEEEFEALLDALHGPGTAPGLAPPSAAAETKPAAAPPAPDNIVPPVKNDPTTAAPAAPIPRAPPPPAAPAAEAGANQGEATVRVDTRRLDHIMNMVGELVLVRNRLIKLEVGQTDEDLSKAVAHIDRVTADLQIAVMKTRMQPIGKLFGRFPRVVRDLARSLRKEVALELLGEDTDLDKNLVEALADPLVHLVRNAVDHGIESPERRAAAGKPVSGQVVLAAGQEGDHIRIVISDDGAGMDPELLRRKAVEKGLLDAETAARCSREECYGLIFLPGLSTKGEISEVSGRGVGMDVVKTRINQLNGSIEVESEPGRGSRFVIRVPLTLAIMPTLMVEVAGQAYALPLAAVSEIFQLDPGHTSTVDGRRVILVRNKPLPLFYLRHWLARDGARAPLPAEAEVLIVNIGAQRVGFVVDRVFGQEEVVIKPLGALTHGTPGLAGATITGNGRIALILDVAGLTRAYGTHRRGVAA